MDFCQRAWGDFMLIPTWATGGGRNGSWPELLQCVSRSPTVVPRYVGSHIPAIELKSTKLNSDDRCLCDVYFVAFGSRVWQSIFHFEFQLILVSVRCCFSTVLYICRSICLTVVPRGNTQMSKYRFEVKQLPGQILTDDKNTYFKVIKLLIYQ